MNYRIAELFNNTSMAASGTEPITLDMANPISQLIIQQRSTGLGGEDAPTAHLAACLPKIEIVDGSDVLFSLAAYELDAFDFYHRKKVAFGCNTYLQGVQGIKTYVINFGRYLWDTELAFDPTRFKNPVLKITYARAAGGNASSALEIQVIAKLFDEKYINPMGFLMHKEIKKYTIANNGWEYTDMPRDYPWRMLLIASRYENKHPHSQFREIKLTEDLDKRIPFHHTTSELIKWMQTEYPLYVENFQGALATHSRTYYVTPGYNAQFAGLPAAAVDLFTAQPQGNGGTLYMEGSGASNVYGTVSGYCPHNSVCIPFGIQSQIDDWYNVLNIGSLKLNIKGHGSANEGDCQICLQQLRTY